VAVYLTAWTLLRPNCYVFEVTYYWGLAGTVQALLTPNLQNDFPTYWFFVYFITHGGIVVGVLFATLALKMRPGKGSILRVFVITNLYMVVTAGANWLLGANYMFLSAPPRGASPFFFFPWPWYIVFLELVAVVFITLLYLPFFLSDRLHSRRQTPS
jgi:hypothetical integral membrane protein (TIGR02206 family)